MPGGSSGGSAAAVAAGFAPVRARVGHGRLHPPARLVLRLVAVKPTYGVVSRYGVVAFGSSLDQVGPFARSVEDAALALNAHLRPRRAGLHEPAVRRGLRGQPRARASRGMKIGIVPAFMEAAGLAPEVQAKVEEAAARPCEKMGAELVEVELPHAQAAMSAYYVLGPCEAFSNLARFDSVRYGYCDPGHKDLGSQYEASRAEGLRPRGASRRIMLGSYLLSAGVYDTYYYPAQQVRTLITRDYAAAFEKVDVILAPVAPTHGVQARRDRRPHRDVPRATCSPSPSTSPATAACRFPVGLGADTGLPVGVQIIAPPIQGQEHVPGGGCLGGSTTVRLRSPPILPTERWVRK